MPYYLKGYLVVDDIPIGYHMQKFIDRRWKGDYLKIGEVFIRHEEMNAFYRITLLFNEPFRSSENLITERFNSEEFIRAMYRQFLLRSNNERILDIDITFGKPERYLQAVVGEPYSLITFSSIIKENYPDLFGKEQSGEVDISNQSIFIRVETPERVISGMLSSLDMSTENKKPFMTVSIPRKRFPGFEKDREDFFL